MIADIQRHLDEQHPNANAVAKKFLLGPGEGGRIQARFQGPDPAELRELGDQAMKVLEDDGGAVCVRSDSRERVKAIRPDLLELQARRNGITRVEVAQALETSFEGRVVGFYREPGYAGTGVFPQETRLLPIIARPPLAEREDVAVINSLQIWSPVAGRMIPLNQVTSGAEVVWEDPIVMRRDRFPTLTVHADPRTGLPSQLFGRVRAQIEQIELPPGYSLEWGGEYEDSGHARAALAEPLPYVLALMVFIVVCLFNSIRTTLLIWLIMPLVIIGVTAGLLLTGMPFGFMALLGVLTLGGELIKNQIVVLSKVLTEIDKGKAPYQAILDGGTSQDAAGVHGRHYDRPGNDPAVEGPVLRGDGGVHHVRAVVRRRPVPDRDAGAVRHLLRHPRAEKQGRISMTAPSRIASEQLAHTPMKKS